MSPIVRLENGRLKIDDRRKDMATLTDAQRKERLSIAWMAAMASTVGLACDEPRTDTDSIDMTLSAGGS